MLLVIAYLGYLFAANQASPLLFGLHPLLLWLHSTWTLHTLLGHCTLYFLHTTLYLLDATQSTWTTFSACTLPLCLYLVYSLPSPALPYNDLTILSQDYPAL